MVSEVVVNDVSLDKLSVKLNRLGVSEAALADGRQVVYVSPLAKRVAVEG